MGRTTHTAAVSAPSANPAIPPRTGPWRAGSTPRHARPIAHSATSRRPVMPQGTSWACHSGSPSGGRRGSNSATSAIRPTASPASAPEARPGQGEWSAMVRPGGRRTPQTPARAATPLRRQHEVFPSRPTFTIGQADRHQHRLAHDHSDLTNPLVASSTIRPQWIALSRGSASAFERRPCQKPMRSAGFLVAMIARATHKSAQGANGCARKSEGLCYVRGGMPWIREGAGRGA
jgi:hypothetical protein